MRWEVVSLVLGWTIGLVSLPLMVVGLYSLFTEGLEPAIRTFAIPTLISISFGGLCLCCLGLDSRSNHRGITPMAGRDVPWPL